MSEGKKIVSNTKTKENKNTGNNSNGKFKSSLVKNLCEKFKSLRNKIKGKDEIKTNDTISLSDIIKDADKLSDNEIKNICDDIKSNNINVGIDSATIQFLSKNKNNENVKKILKQLSIPMNVDISSLANFRKTDVENVKEIFKDTGCKIDKVYINTGWDEAAKRGCQFEKYEQIISNAEKVLKKATKNLPNNASKQDTVMAIYNQVLKMSNFDYSALNSNSSRKYSSRNLEGFFLNNGSAVCAGIASAFQNLCECAGIEVEYVQGMAKSRRMGRPEYHAWVKVKLDDGKWYNCDPTWDANKVGRKYEYCLKSDRDFKGHKQDKSYNPTYERGNGAHKNINKKRSYNESYVSKDTNRLCEDYKDSEVDKALKISKNKRQKQIINNDDLKYAEKNKIPISDNGNKNKTRNFKENTQNIEEESVSKKRNFKQKIAEILSKTKKIKNISFIKKFIEKNMIDKIDKINEKNISEIKEEINDSKNVLNQNESKINEHKKSNIPSQSYKSNKNQLSKSNFPQMQQIKENEIKYDENNTKNNNMKDMDDLER